MIRVLLYVAATFGFCEVVRVSCFKFWAVMLLVKRGAFEHL